MAEESRIERVTLIVMDLIEGQEISAAELAARFSVHRSTIYKDLADISRVIAIYPDHGRWRVIEIRE